MIVKEKTPVKRGRPFPLLLSVKRGEERGNAPTGISESRRVRPRNDAEKMRKYRK